MNKKSIFIVLLVNTLITVGLCFLVFTKLSQKPTKNELIADFYAVENAVVVSPHGLRKSMDTGEVPYTIVDLRSKQEYEKEHILGAVNIPAYSDPDTSAYGEIERITSEFEKLPKGKEIVVYCYSMPCMTGRKVGSMLAEKGIYVKHLGIGWNEWRYFWNLWNHEHEWDLTEVDNYVVSGNEPGNYVKKNSEPTDFCSLDKNFGC